MNKKRKISSLYQAAFIIGLVLLMLLGTAKVRAASFVEITDSACLHAYPLSQKAFPIYSDHEMTSVAGKGTYKEYKIVKFFGNTMQLVYKAEDGTRKKGYASASCFLQQPSGKREGMYVGSSGGIDIYKVPKNSSSQRFIHAAQADCGLKVGEKGQWTQVMIQKKRQYYLGWIPTSRFKSSMFHFAVRTGQILADGRYTLCPALVGTDTLKKTTYDVKYIGTGLYTLKNVKKGYLQVDNSRQVRIQKKGDFYYLLTGSRKLALNAKGETEEAVQDQTQAWNFQKKSTRTVTVIYSQYDPEYGKTVYKDGNIGPRTISTSGCGVMALVNAIYALNGSYIPPERLARFSAARGHYFYNAGTADTLYPDVAEKWGKKYRFKYDGLTGSFAELQKHLRKGGTAVALVPGHYLAIAKYRSSDGKYLILDSAVGGRRPTSINGDWMSMGQLQSGALFCQHFHLFSAVKASKNRS